MKLSHNEQLHIKELEKSITDFKNVLENCAKFTLDDILIAYTKSYDYGWMGLGYNQTEPKFDKPVLNSNQLPKKFKVVFVDANGIPYIKEINRSGKPQGRLLSTVSFHGDRDTIMTHNEYYRFSLDPEFVDATLMDHEYDPTEKNRHYSQVRKEVAAHNKAIKIPLNSEEQVNDFFTNVKVGEVYWRSNSKSITITEISVRKTSKLQKAISDDDSYIEVRTNKGKTEKYRTWNLFYMNLYKEQPKSFQKSV